MPKKLTQEEWIEKARKVHGDKYDYSKVQYVSADKKVLITCLSCGRDFEQLAGNHLKGKGCSYCRYDKARATLNDRYGVDNAAKVDGATERMRATMMERYGVENAMDVPGFRDKMAATCLERYGKEHYSSTDECKARVHASFLRHYGVDRYSQTDECKRKVVETALSRYGVCNVMCSDVIQARLRDVVRAKYGVDNYMLSSEFESKSRDTMIKKYGTVRYLDSVESKARHGEYQRKGYLTRKKNGTLGSSKAENILKDILIDHFGDSDVVFQYKSDRYPFLCDYYVKSLDLYIELNGLWTHGCHWFGAGCSDEDLLQKWKSRPDSGYYKDAIDTWAYRDVMKREAAKAAGLNYVVFWMPDLLDAELWFALGCPIGRDWEREYSWLPMDRILTEKIDISNIGSGPYQWSRIAKKYQFDVIYTRELALWNDSSAMYRGFPLKAFLYCNRYKYLDKLPDELSDNEILSGFTISGILRGYTRFDATAMLKFLEKHNIASVYDPCAGWGERMLACASVDAAYLGVDIRDMNSAYGKMILHFGSDKQRFCCADAAAFVPSDKYDAVVTCPPYGDIEIYSEDGAENLNEDDFAAWWDKVCENCMAADPDWFCVQTNAKYCELFSAGILAQGFEPFERIELSTRESHFVSGRKKECELFLIFKKKCAF